MVSERAIIPIFTGLFAGIGWISIYIMCGGDPAAAWIGAFLGSAGFYCGVVFGQVVQ